MSPPEWVREEISPVESYGYCAHDGASKVFGALIIVVILCALVLAITQAYKARSMSDELSESTYIGMAMFGSFQALIIGVPVAFLVGENSTALFFVQAGLIFLVSMSILLLVIVPKIALVISERRGGRSATRTPSSDNCSRELSDMD